ncbi:hypothetical protein EX895_001557 [Sporisorium graminicola]|uniref:Nephrocystin 3-like N-terminal domain-containing protein n=1 Tax=Sporisorium graminicola TaxID=280036 RepID=A0A4U7KXI4_9BASI|nr:hypothetical protein EX895_001557 [Sporisorium graminicola]TKY89026.1 hypothetical protein EX895_001557 [Sporisorium graminicola]
MNVLGLGRNTLQKLGRSASGANMSVQAPDSHLDDSADAIKPRFDRSESHLTALTESTDAITQLDTPLTTPSVTDQQHSFLTMHQPSIEIRRNFVVLIDDLSDQDFADCDLECYLEFLSHERLLHMPHKNSAWDKVLRQAEEIGAQLNHFSQLAADEHSLKTTLLSVRLLLDVGHHQADALRPLFELLSQIANLLMRSLHQSNLYRAHNTIRSLLLSLFTRYMSLTAELTRHVRSRMSRLSPASSEAIDVGALFSAAIDSIDLELAQLNRLVWRLALQQQHKPALVSTATMYTELCRTGTNSLKSRLFASLQRQAAVAPETCEWFQSPLLSFLRSREDVLQITGKQGSGKSTLAVWTQERLRRTLGRKSYDVLLINEHDSHTDLDLARSLLFQVWQQSIGDVELHSDLADVLVRDNDDDELADGLWNVLERTLARNQSGNDMLILVDGLNTRHEKAYQHLHRCVQRSPRARMVTFGGAFSEHLPDYKITRDVNAHDIATYLRHGLTKQSIAHNDGLIDSLFERANGSFLWARLYLELVRLHGEHNLDCTHDIHGLLHEHAKHLGQAGERLLQYMLVAKRALCWNELEALMRPEILQAARSSPHASVFFQEIRGHLYFRHATIRSFAKDHLVKDEQDLQTRMLRKLLLSVAAEFTDVSLPCLDLLAGKELEATLNQGKAVEYTVLFWQHHFARSGLSAKDLAEWFPRSTHFALLEWSYWNHHRHLAHHTAGLDVRKACFGKDHLSVMQSYLALACIHRDHNQLSEAAEYFYYACRLGQEGSCIDRFSLIVTTCASLFLVCTETLVWTKRTELCTMREHMIRFTIEVCRRQHGEHSEQVIHLYQMLIQLLVSIKDQAAVIVVYRELYHIFLHLHGPRHERTKHVCNEMAGLEVVVHGDNTELIDTYVTSILETVDEYDEEHEHEGHIMVLLRLARSYAKHTIHWHHACRLYLTVWRRLGEKCRRQWSLDMTLLKIDVCIEYAKLLHAHGRITEAHDVLVVLWAEFQHQECREYSIILRLKQLGLVLRAFGLLSICYEIFVKIFGWFKGCGKLDDDEAHEVTIIVTEVTEEIEEITRKTKTTTKVTVTETVTREVFETHYERCIRTKKGDKHLYKACLLLINLLLKSNNYEECEIVITRTLEVEWSNFLDFSIDISIPDEHVLELLVLAGKLAHCHQKRGHVDHVERYYLRIWHACLHKFEVHHEHVTHAFEALICFYEEHYRYDKVIALYLDVLVRYREHCGAAHTLTIQLLYKLARLCKKMGRHDYIEYYLEIFTVLQGHHGHCHREAWEAAWEVCGWKHDHSEWASLVEICGTLWQVFVHGGHEHGHHHHDFFTPEVILVLYERYTKGLEVHVGFHFEEHYKLTIEFRDVIKLRYGVDHSLLIRALIALAEVCEYKEEHHHEAVTLYEEVITRTRTVTVETITEEEITVVKKRLTKVYVQIIEKGGHHGHAELGDNALRICMEVYLELKKQHGCWHELTLSALERVVLIHFAIGGDHHHHSMLVLMQTIVVEVLQHCTESMLLYKAAVHIAKILVRIELSTWAEKLLCKLHHLIVLPGLPCEHDFDIEWTHAHSDDFSKISLVFIVACLHRLGHYEHRSYSEVMAAVLLEMQLYRSFVHVSSYKTVDMVVLLQAGARLHCFWHALGRTALCSSILDQMLVHFRASELGSCVGDEVSDEVVLVLLQSLHSHTDGEKRITDVAKVVCHAINHKVEALLESGEFSMAHELAKCGLKLARHHRHYHMHVSLGYKLAEYMAGIHVPVTTSKKLGKAMRTTSRAITDEVLYALRQSSIELLSLRFQDIQGLVYLLGVQSNFAELETLLLQLWRSREVQRNWSAETVLSIGHSLVHAHVAADHLDQAIALCDRLCYNLRHSGDGLDDQAVEASQLLAQLYTKSARHDRAMRVYEEVLREVDEDGSPELFDKWAGKHLGLIRCSYGRNRGFANNAATYRDLFASLEARGLECKHEEWELNSADQLGGAETGGYAAPDKWFLIRAASVQGSEKVDAHGHVHEHAKHVNKPGKSGNGSVTRKGRDSLSRIASRRSRGCQLVAEIVV